MLPGCRQFRRDPDLFHWYLRGRTKVQGQGTGCGNSIQTVRMPALRFTHFTLRPDWNADISHHQLQVTWWSCTWISTWETNHLISGWGRSQSYPWFSISFPFERQVCSTFVPLAFSPTPTLPTCHLTKWASLRWAGSGGRQEKKQTTRWWFQMLFTFTPNLGEMTPIWRIFFKWVGSTTS